MNANLAKRWTRVIALVGSAAVIGGSSAAHGDTTTSHADKLKLFGDFRLRLEEDWDSHQANGTPRTDRGRARIRLRAGAKYDLTPALTFGARVRSGSVGSQQSPHITIYDFQDNSLGPRDAVLDQWYAKWSKQHFSAWVGRNDFPFWKQNELFWDDDVTPAGLAVSYNAKHGPATDTINAGYFYLPDGGVHFNGNLTALQFVHVQKLRAMDLTAAGGYFVLDGKSGAIYLRNGNGSRDYHIWVGNLQGKWQARNRPLVLGSDFMHNAKSYSATDPNAFTVANRNEKDGYVLYGEWGQLKKKSDWLFGYYYAHIETLAVNASYAQDDWVRWGSTDQTDSSDFRGHELRAAYALSSRSNLMLRLYLVHAITSVQDGKRIRLDFNTKF